MYPITPYLKFNDNKCREAMDFYKNIFGGELTMQTVGESPMASEMPPESKDKIMHSQLKKGDMVIFGSDMMRDKAVVGDNVSLSVNCESEESMRKMFDALSKGGDVFMPIEKAFWGSLFGVVTDKYGFEWMLMFGEDPDK